MKNAMVLGGVLLVVGCGGAPPEPPRAPAAPTAASTEPSSPHDPPQAKADPWALPGAPRDETQSASPPKDVATAAWAKASKVKGVSAPPATCAAFVKPSPAKAADLKTVIETQDAVKRNALLAALEPQDKWIRVTRAELAPTECADGIVDPLLAPSSSVPGEPGQVAIGLSLAAKLARTATTAPAMKDASDKEKVKRFIQGPLRAWMVEQATAIEALSAPAAELTGVARGLVAIEAGMADLRLVDRIRSAPTPSSWDKELKAIYEAALDEALEPRKTRGRDAALRGLADFAAEGIVHDARVTRARALLSKLYGGRRIDALDELLLPPENEPPSVPERTLARVDPSFVRTTSARARFEMGRNYWRRVDFVEAAHAAAKDKTPDGRLLLALSLALSKGPTSAGAMMAAPAPSALGLGNTDALDALAAEPSSVAGMAAFDAAHLRSLSPPDGAAAGPWFADVSARFEKAASLLEDPAQKKRAKERAAAADATSKAVGTR